MNPPYLLAQPPSVLPPLSPRSPPHPPLLKVSDPAVRAMTDFLEDPPRTVAQDSALDQVVDHMFRFGVRAFLVVDERAVIGLITAEDVSDAQHAMARCGTAARELRAADVMTPSLDVPAIDWRTLQESRIADLLEIFEGSGVRYLVVLQTETASWSTVRGLINRQRLERALRRS